MEEKPKASQQKVSTPSIVIGTLIAVTIFVFIISAASNSSQPASTPSAAANSAPSQNQSAQLEVRSLRVYRDELGDACITGLVVNTSTQELDYIEANIAFNDKNGNLIEPANTYLQSQNLTPGEQSTFQVCGDTNSDVVLNQTTLNFTGMFVGATQDMQLNIVDNVKPVINNQTPVNPLNQQIQSVQNQIQQLKQQNSTAAANDNAATPTAGPTWHTVFTISNDFNISKMPIEGPFNLQGSQTRITLSCALTYGASTGALVASIYVPHTSANFPSSVHCPADGAQNIINDIPPGQYSLSVMQITNGQGSGNLQSYTVTIEDYY